MPYDEWERWFIENKCTVTYEELEKWKTQYYCGLNTYEEFKSLLKKDYEIYCKEIE